ncbi:hypothetical protein DSCW_04200 [Desulfosarcina widdelii]|uniref:DUF5615 domain-containing protein n=1 Tax=Desulfosarcina widdelii TaxID=947919 RepID=A0A5K7YYK1_9BACT|nr:hypothetical protein DSCW_04200 [Desulfosarcina widdelii]
MKILVDENIPVTTVNKLREQGNDVLFYFFRENTAKWPVQRDIMSPVMSGILPIAAIKGPFF